MEDGDCGMQIFNKLIGQANKKAYTYNPLPGYKRRAFSNYISKYFKSKAEFARESGVDQRILVAIINNTRCGDAITWKKINDAIERRGLKLPASLQIKYEVDEKFGGK